MIRDAFDGVSRFGDFQRSLGAARSILSDRLRRLVEAGILQLQPASDGSAYQNTCSPTPARNCSRCWSLRQWENAIASGRAKPTRS